MFVYNQIILRLNV